MKPISLQLYTLRENAAKDFMEVLQTVAQIGFKGVETAGLHGHDPKEIAKIIHDLGMQVSSSHAEMPTPENIQEIVDIHKALGCTRVISGFGPEQFETIDGCKAAIEKFNVATELLNAQDISFGFHNHWWEFNTIDGKFVYDIILEMSSSIFSELDIYWVSYAGANPVDIVSKYKSRIPLLHIKDGMLSKDDMTAVGAGVIDMFPIINETDPNVLEWVVVELDACKTDMIEAVRQSYQYLTTNNLAYGNK